MILLVHKAGALRLLSQKYHRLGSLSSSHLCLTFLKASQVQDQDIGRCGAWGESTSRFTDGCFLSVSSCGRKGSGREREMSLWSLIRTLIPFMRALLTWPNHLPKTLPPFVTSRIFQHRNFVGTQTSGSQQGVCVYECTQVLVLLLGELYWLKLWLKLGELFHAVS